MTKINLAISYSGGKDSNLSLIKVSKDERYDIALLVTFVPAQSEHPFLSHNLDVIKCQADALDIPHKVILIQSEPSYLESYQNNIRRLNEEYGIKGLVTGDILPVCSDFMERAVNNTGVELIRPYWGISSEALLSDLFNENLKTYITCISKKKLKNPEKWVGRLLTQELLKEMMLDRIDGEDMNIVGEFGEYHTMCLSSPLYKKEIQKVIKPHLDMPSIEYILREIKTIAKNVQISPCGNYCYWNFMK